MILLGLFITLSIGWLFLDAINLDAKLFEKLGLSFIISSGIQTLFFFAIAEQSNNAAPRLYWITSAVLLVGLFLLKKYIRGSGPNSLIYFLRRNRPTKRT